MRLKNKLFLFKNLLFSVRNENKQYGKLCLAERSVSESKRSVWRNVISSSQSYFFDYDAYGRIRLESWGITCLRCEVICNSHAPLQCVKPTYFFQSNVSLYLSLCKPTVENHFKMGNDQLNSCSKILLSKITLAQLDTTHTSPFKELDISLLCSQQPVIDPYPEPDVSSPTKFIFSSHSHQIL